jgi:hypothetical protein
MIRSCTRSYSCGWCAVLRSEVEDWAAALMVWLGRHFCRLSSTGYPSLSAAFSASSHVLQRAYIRWVCIYSVAHIYIYIRNTRYLFFAFSWLLQQPAACRFQSTTPPSVSRLIIHHTITSSPAGLGPSMRPLHSQIDQFVHWQKLPLKLFLEKHPSAKAWHQKKTRI